MEILLKINIFCIIMHSIVLQRKFIPCCRRYYVTKEGRIIMGWIVIPMIPFLPILIPLTFLMEGIGEVVSFFEGLF